MDKEAMRKAFLAKALADGYDTANTYDTERSHWVFLSPMTADLWTYWQAAIAHSREAEHARIEAIFESYMDFGEKSVNWTQDELVLWDVLANLRADINFRQDEGA